MSPETADWIRLTVLPPLWRRDDGIDELRTCACQAPPSEWLGGIEEPAARLWDRDGRTVAYPDGQGLVTVWMADRTCIRRRPEPASSAA